MTRYLTLLRFTDQGAKNLKKSPARAAAFRKAAEQQGVKVETQFWASGAYDGLIIVSADDETKALAVIAKLSALGNVRTETSRLFDAREFAAIVGG